MADLLPCPFCGSVDIEFSDQDVDWAGVCQGCHGVSPWQRTRELAVIAWNRREDPNRLPMELLPEGWTIFRLNLHRDSGAWGCILENRNNEPKKMDFGPTPRAAMLAAIENISPQHD